MKRVMSKEALKSGRVTRTRTDWSREFISLLGCICADGSFLPPALIYKGASHDLDDSWLGDVGGDTDYFAVTDNGWTYDGLRLDRLRCVSPRSSSPVDRRLPFSRAWSWRSVRRLPSLPLSQVLPTGFNLVFSEGVGHVRPGTSYLPPADPSFVVGIPPCISP
jgi:hypothetical protein